MKLRACISALLFVSIAATVRGETYSVFGMVIRADRAHHSLEASCQAVPGFMGEAVKTFSVLTAEELNGLEPGTLIDFTLHVDKNAEYAEHVRIHQYDNTAQEPMAARQLEILETATQPLHGRDTLQLGQSVPDFTLLDQNKQPLTLSTLRGKLVALTFIYTRCPLPNFCFRMSNNFGVLHRDFAARMDKDLVLLSISFDPEHDLPETLAEYARTFTTNTTGWHFLTGPSTVVSEICREFRVTSWQDEGLMTHNLHTVILDRQGRVAANLEGNEYTARQLSDLVRVLLEHTP